MKIDVLGVQINSDTKNTIIFYIKKLLDENKKNFITTPYSEMLVAAQKDTGFREVLNSSDFALPDGFGVQWAAKYLQLTTYNLLLNLWHLITSLGSIIFYPKYIHSPIPERISGSDFVWDLARLAADRGYSIFLLGGFGNTPGLATAALKKKFQNLKIAGTNNLSLRGGQQDNEAISRLPRPSQSLGARNDELIIKQINNSNTDFLFVAFGPIRQEKWIAENLPKMNIKLAIGLGGTFDYLASKRMLAPQIWRSVGLEWLWRLMTQPWRLWRISKGVLGLIWYSIKAKI